jgi:hypothetical protein
MTLTITSLRVDSCETEGWFAAGKVACPYLVVNCCFKVDKDEDTFIWERAKGESEEYHSVLTVDDPERYEDWISNQCGFDQFRYEGYGRAWTHKDPPWRYVEKFDTFWFREWIADCSVTRAIIAELQHYKKHGVLPSVYRSVEQGIILQHLSTLHSYWD